MSDLSDDDKAALERGEEAARISAGQRRVNIIWEITQSAIALSVCTATLYVATSLALLDPAQLAGLGLLQNAFFLVVGFYFGRTNHQRVGGISGHNRMGR